MGRAHVVAQFVGEGPLTAGFAAKTAVAGDRKRIRRIEGAAVVTQQRGNATVGLPVAVEMPDQGHHVGAVLLAQAVDLDLDGLAAGRADVVEHRAVVIAQRVVDQVAGDNTDADIGLAVGIGLVADRLKLGNARLHDGLAAPQVEQVAGIDHHDVDHRLAGFLPHLPFLLGTQPARSRVWFGRQQHVRSVGLNELVGPFGRQQPGTLGIGFHLDGASVLGGDATEADAIADREDHRLRTQVGVHLADPGQQAVRTPFTANEAHAAVVAGQAEFQ